MLRLRWDDVSHLFDPELMGSLPDGWVDDTTVSDWQTLFDLVRAGAWPWTWYEGADAAPLQTAEDVFSRPAVAELVSLAVEFADGAIAIFRPGDVTRIDFDIDLRFLQGQERLDALCGFFATLARALGKSVWLGPEGRDHDPALGFHVVPDRMVVVAETPPP